MAEPESITVTRKMILAGVGVCPAFASDYLSAAEVVAEIYREMEAARNALEND